MMGRTLAVNFQPLEQEKVRIFNADGSLEQRSKGGRGVGLLSLMQAKA
jgi:hypothetical protein